MLNPKGLSQYSHVGLTAMADLLAKIKHLSLHYPMPAEFVQELDALSWELDEEIDAGLNDMEEFEAQKMALAG